MIYLGLWFMVLGISAVHAASINQQTGGPCSPIVGQTGGNVSLTINCPGMDPKVLDGLNRELGLTKAQLNLSNQQVEQITKKANELARKYEDLSQQFKALQDNKLISQGQALLDDWKLERADNLLKRSTISMAQYHAIQEGMSYPDVVKILGRDGVEQGRGGNVVNYGWRNPDRSQLVVVFINGQAGPKSQANLR